MTQEVRSKRRILIGATSFTDARAAFAIADRLAESLASKLGGILMHDTAINELVASPGQRVVTESGEVIAAPSSARLRAIFESDVKAFRRALDELARLRSLASSFERREGEPIAGLCEAAAEWDVLLLGQRCQSPGRGRIVLVAPGTGVYEDLDEMAHDLAAKMRADLVTVTLNDAGSPGGGEFTWADETELLKWISRVRAAVVIVDLAKGPFRTPDQLRKVLEAARCPVLVAGTARTGQADTARPAQDEGKPET